ncbi:unnamed protein product [Parnassius mnemosyne]|uniref:Serine/threonine-protein phosphatase 6 regulatory subunit 2 n=1 Tax=Parnassius mnemosyne TaxID=213953 RepID=A0AAV1KSF6_9NEOP
MFWRGNFVLVREINNLLKEENVTLTQVLEADNILQECKADNKALILFLTKPEILGELVTLITEEPPKNVDMTSQYRHAHIASEVLTSQLMMLSDRLSMDVVQMNRLCDFVNKDPPLNPLLASYFSKTIEMLLEKSPKQDWYLYHIVVHRVLDFFKSRRDFLPNLLRHISTSSIADIFKYFIRLDDPFNKIVFEWLEEHQFLESLIQIICGTYEYEEIRPANITDGAERSPEQTEKGQQETSEKVELNHKQEDKNESMDNAAEEEKLSREKRRIAEAGRASANAAALLCDLLLGACDPPGNIRRAATAWRLVARLRGAATVRLLLQGMFTSPPAARRHAVVNGCQLLLALLPHDSSPSPSPSVPHTFIHSCLKPTTHVHVAAGGPQARRGQRLPAAARAAAARLLALALAVSTTHIHTLLPQTNDACSRRRRRPAGTPWSTAASCCSRCCRTTPRPRPRRQYHTHSYTLASNQRRMFTSPPAARRHAVVNGCQLLLALLPHDSSPSPSPSVPHTFIHSCLKPTTHVHVAAGGPQARRGQRLPAAARAAAARLLALALAVSTTHIHTLLPQTNDACSRRRRRPAGTPWSTAASCCSRCCRTTPRPRPRRQYHTHSYTLASNQRRMFTSPPAARRHAVVNGCQLLLALLPHDSSPSPSPSVPHTFIHSCLKPTTHVHVAAGGPQARRGQRLPAAARAAAARLLALALAVSTTHIHTLLPQTNDACSRRRRRPAGTPWSTAASCCSRCCRTTPRPRPRRQYHTHSYTLASNQRRMFTSPPAARRHAVVNGCQLLLALLPHDSSPSPSPSVPHTFIHSCLKPTTHVHVAAGGPQARRGQRLPAAARAAAARLLALALAVSTTHIHTLLPQTNDACSRRRRRPAGTPWSTAASCCSRCCRTTPRPRPRRQYHTHSYTLASNQRRMFTSPPAARRHAVVNGCQLLLALLPHDSSPSPSPGNDGGGESSEESASVQRAVAPHLPLLHQALLRPPTPPPPEALVAPEAPPASAAPATNVAPVTSVATEIPVATETPVAQVTPVVPEAPAAPPPPTAPSTDVNMTSNEEESKDTEGKGKSEGLELESKEGSESEHKADAVQENSVEHRDAGDGAEERRAGRVGAARVHVAALVAQLAFSELQDVHNALLTLGTPGVLIDMFFDYPQNNFLHTQVYILIHNALSNRLYGERYARHLIDECNLLTRLMDTFEANENTKVGAGSIRRGNMGHVVLALRRLEGCAPAEPGAAQRWLAFREHTLRPLLLRHDTPLGGFYPSDNIYVYSEASGVNESITAVQLSCDENSPNSKNSFLELADQRFDDDTWDENNEAEADIDADAGNDAQEGAQEEPNLARINEYFQEVSGELGIICFTTLQLPSSPNNCLRGGFNASWDAAEDNATDGTEWANFEDAFANPADPFAPATEQSPFQQQDFTPFWAYGDRADAEDSKRQSGLEQSMQGMNLGNEFEAKPIDEASTAELTNNLLTAMSSMAPDVIADIVSAMPRADEPLAETLAEQSTEQSTNPADPESAADR